MGDLLIFNGRHGADPGCCTAVPLSELMVGMYRRRWLRGGSTLEECAGSETRSYRELNRDMQHDWTNLREYHGRKDIIRKQYKEVHQSIDWH